MLQILPLLLVFVAGVALAVRKWRQHPMPARLSLAGLVVLLLYLLVMPTVHIGLVNWVLNMFGEQASRLLSSGIQLFLSVMNMLGVLLIGGAAWLGREEA